MRKVALRRSWMTGLFKQQRYRFTATAVKELEEFRTIEKTRLDHKRDLQRFRRLWTRYTESKTKLDKEAVENLLVLNEGQKRRAKLVNDYITRLSCEERLLFNRMLLDRALLEQEINDYDFHMIEELTTLDLDPLSLIDAKKQYGEYLVGKLYTHPDVIDVMLEELGDFLKQAGPADDQGEEEVEEVVVKNIFDVELTEINDKAKIKIIKDVKNLLGLGLKDAKTMVENAPAILKSEVPTEEAEKMKEALEAHGCTVTLK